MYIFGCFSDHYKIAILEDCSFQELPIRLFYEYDWGHSAIEIDGGERALICFDEGNRSGKNCEIFDTASSIATHSTQYLHTHGRLGYYKGQPTTVSSNKREKWGKVETYSPSGWEPLPDHPKYIGGHTLIGLDGGALLMAGGEEYRYDDYNRPSIKDIWRLKDDEWVLLGSLKEFTDFGSSLKIGDYIYIVTGNKKNSNGLYPVERIEVEIDDVISTEVIGEHDFVSIKLALFETTVDF